MWCARKNQQCFFMREWGVSLLILFFFACFYTIINGMYLSIDGLIYSPMATQWVKLEYPVSDSDALMYLKQLVLKARYDAIVGHPILVPLHVFSHRLCASMFPNIGYRLPYQILMSVVSALGLLFFYQILRIAGKTVAVSLSGVLILGLGNIYRNVAETGSSMFSIFALMIVIRAFFSYLASTRNFLSIVKFSAVFAVALLFYESPLLLLPGILICYVCVEKRFWNIVRFIIVSFFSVWFLTDMSCRLLFKYIAQHYGGNVYNFECKDFFDYIAYFIHWLNITESRGENLAQVLYSFVCGIAQSLYVLPRALYFPVGVLLLYCVALIILVKTRKSNKDPFFIVMGTNFFIIFMITIALRVIDLPKGAVSYVVFFSYILAEGVQLVVQGDFKDVFRRRMVRVVTLLLATIFAYSVFFDLTFPFYNSFFNWNPAGNKDLLNKRFFTKLDEIIPPGSVVLYDYTYVGVDFGNMLSNNTSLVTPTTINFYYQGESGNGSEYFLEYYLANNNPKKFYIICSRCDADQILVPADRYLHAYLVFNKHSTIVGQWCVYRYDGERKTWQEVFDIYGRVTRDNRLRRAYGINEVFWKLKHTGKSKLLAMVPIESDIVENQDYRKSKNLVFW